MARVKSGHWTGWIEEVLGVNRQQVSNKNGLKEIRKFFIILQSVRNHSILISANHHLILVFLNALHRQVLFFQCGNASAHGNCA